MVVVMAKINGHTRKGGLYGEWPLREEPVYMYRLAYIQGLP